MWVKEKIKRLLMKNDKIYKASLKIREHFWFYCISVLIGIYLYGMIINSIRNAMRNFTQGTINGTVSLNPIKCFAAVFTPQGVGVLFFIFIMYVLIAGKWMHFITGVKITKDERNFFVSNEGTHGTSGWMNKKEREKVLQTGSADKLPCPILCKIKDGRYVDDKYMDYVGLRSGVGLNNHTMVYGASGAGKSRGFVKPFILKMAKFQAEKKESMILVDPKGGATRSQLKRLGMEPKIYGLKGAA